MSDEVLRAAYRGSVACAADAKSLARAYDAVRWELVQARKEIRGTREEVERLRAYAGVAEVRALERLRRVAADMTHDANGEQMVARAVGVDEALEWLLNESQGDAGRVSSLRQRVDRMLAKVLQAQEVLRECVEQGGRGE